MAAGTFLQRYALTGWIPEQFRTDDKDFEPQRLWQRMVSATKCGDCLMTRDRGLHSTSTVSRRGAVTAF
jgi:hypothetical protein